MKDPRYMTARELADELRTAELQAKIAKLYGEFRNLREAEADARAIQDEQRRRDPKGNYR